MTTVESYDQQAQALEIQAAALDIYTQINNDDDVEDGQVTTTTYDDDISSGYLALVRYSSLSGMHVLHSLVKHVKHKCTGIGNG